MVPHRLRCTPLGDPRSPGRVALVVLALAVGALGSCSSDRDRDGAPALIGGASPVAWRSGDGPRSFALALGSDPSDEPTRARLAAHDLVVVDGTETAREQIGMLQRAGTVVLGYLSVGTLEPGRPWFAEAEAQGWLLERWEQWDEWYADVADPELRRLLVDVAADVLAHGVDGLFLDNTDLAEQYPDQREPMAALVADLDALVGPDRLLFAQNGDPEALGFADHLDGWNLEDVSFTFDPVAGRYVPVSEDERRTATDRLRAAATDGLIVTATDYLPEPTPELVSEAVAVACDHGAVPFVAPIELDRIADPPLTC